MNNTIIVDDIPVKITSLNMHGNYLRIGDTINVLVCNSYERKTYTITNIDYSTNRIYIDEEYAKSKSSEKQKSKKHKGQKYKPTALDRLNQSKQSKSKSN